MIALLQILTTTNYIAFGLPQNPPSEIVTIIYCCNTHTHTHTHIYIYIFQEKKNNIRSCPEYTDCTSAEW